MKFDMRSTITLQNRPNGQNPVGGKSPVVNVGTFRAAYIPNNGMQYAGASQVHTESDCEFRIRYPMSGILPTQGMYVEFNHNTYYILAVDDEGGLHREMRIVCKLEK
jgi:SPP1 family predicted phage head-tail adaptor